MDTAPLLSAAKRVGGGTEKGRSGGEGGGGKEHLLGDLEPPLLPGVKQSNRKENVSFLKFQILKTFNLR